MAFVKSVYYETELESMINIRPDQMIPGFDIVQVLLDNLRNDIEKKCNSESYIASIMNLTDYKHGMIDRNNSTGHAIYKVRYRAYICSPTKGQTLIAKYDTKIPEKLFAMNGPIMVIIPDDAISDSVFSIDASGDIIFKDEKRKIGIDDYLVVQVERAEYIQNDSKIIIGAKLLGLADKKQIKVFENQQKQLIDTDIEEIEGDFI